MKITGLGFNKNGEYSETEIEWEHNYNADGVMERKLLWVPIPRIDYGTLTKTAKIMPHGDETCVYDMQAGHDHCYSADYCKTTDGNRVIFLQGNGWCEVFGYPHGEFSYPLLTGKTKDNFLIWCDKDVDEGGLWKDIYSGDINDLIGLVYEKEVV